MIEIRQALTLCVVVGAITFAGCSKQETPVAEETGAAEVAAPEPAPAPAPAPMVAVAQMTSRAGLEIIGSISFTQAEPDTPTVIAAHFEGVAEGAHGLHVHPQVLRRLLDVAFR